MRCLFPLITIFLLLSSSISYSQAPVLGQNVGGSVYYGNGVKYTNLMKSASYWRADSTGDSHFDLGISLRTDGYPTEAPFDPDDGGPLEETWWWTYLVANVSNKTEFPLQTGTYKLKWEGTGKVWISTGTCSGVPECRDGEDDPTVIYDNWNKCCFSSDGVTHDVPHTSNGMTLHIVESDVADPVRNIQIMLPGYLPDDGSIFTPNYISKMENYGVLRTMDTTHTNHNHGQVDWADRTPLNYYTWASIVDDSGARDVFSSATPWEIVFEMAEVIGTNLWITLPGEATDAYIQQLALLINSELDSGVELYVEYSNETWNTLFDITTYIKDQTDVLWPALGETQANDYYTSYRSAQMWEVLDTYLDPSRVWYKVLASQNANIWRTENRVYAVESDTYNTTDPKQLPDFLSTTLYFGDLNYVLTEGGTIDQADVTEATVAAITNEEVHQYILNRFETLAVPRLIMNTNYARTEGYGHIIYEGGLSLVRTVAGWPQLPHDSSVTVDLVRTYGESALNEEIYEMSICAYILSGDLLYAHYSGIGDALIWGYWGTWEHIDATSSAKQTGMENGMARASELQAVAPMTDPELVWNYCSAPAATGERVGFNQSGTVYFDQTGQINFNQ